MRLQDSYIFNSNSLKKILSAFMVCALIFAEIVFAQNITRQKVASARDLLYKEYFKAPNQYDVYFLGTSHVMYGISPLEIWEEYGITSYNWGSPTCTIPQSYWKFKLLQKYHSPKLVVIDCFRAIWENKVANEYRMHEAFDAFPLSVEKSKATIDLMYREKSMDSDQEFRNEELINILIPFSAYHSRWDSLDEQDFNNEYIDTKGAEFEINVAQTIEISHTSEKTRITDNMEGVKYLRRLIEDCKSDGIEILLVYLPYPIEEIWKEEANMIYDIAREYNVNYLDFTQEDVVDYTIDYADSTSHMNVVGQDKVSRALGKYIKENYEIEDHSGDEAYRNWDDCYAEYRNYKDGFLLDQEVLSNYLMLLNDTNCDCVIEIKDSIILKEERYRRLLEAICSKVDESTRYIVRVNGIMVAIDDLCATDEFQINNMVFRTEFSDEGYSLLVDNKPLYYGADDRNTLAIQVNKSKEIFDQVAYRYLTDTDGNVASDRIERILEVRQ